MLRRKSALPHRRKPLKRTDSTSCALSLSLFHLRLLVQHSKDKNVTTASLPPLSERALQIGCQSVRGSKVGRLDMHPPNRRQRMIGSGMETTFASSSRRNYRSSNMKGRSSVGGAALQVSYCPKVRPCPSFGRSVYGFPPAPCCCPFF